MIYGIIKNDKGQIVSKAELPHIPNLQDSFTFEQMTKAEMEEVEVYQEPPTQAEIEEQKIRAETRRIAIENLKQAGELSADFVDRAVQI